MFIFVQVHGRSIGDEIMGSIKDASGGVVGGGIAVLSTSVSSETNGERVVGRARSQ